MASLSLKLDQEAPEGTSSLRAGAGRPCYYDYVPPTGAGRYGRYRRYRHQEVHVMAILEWLLKVTMVGIVALCASLFTVWTIVILYCMATPIK